MRGGKATREALAVSAKYIVILNSLMAQLVHKGLAQLETGKRAAFPVRLGVIPEGKGAELPPPNGAFVTCTITFDLTRRFRMLGMRWKALGRAMNLS